MYQNAYLVALKARVDAAFPGREKLSADGNNYEGIGKGKCDQSHANANSPHCRGDAVDLHHDPKSGASGDAIAAMAIKDPNVKKVIFNGMTWERSTGKWRVFKGKDPHRHHVHIEADPSGAKPAARTITPGKKKKAKTPAVAPIRKKGPKKTTDASPAMGPAGGKLLVDGDPGVLLGEAQLTAAHVKTPHTGGGVVKQGSPGVFIGEQQLAFARIGDPTSDGYNVKTGDTGILVG